MNTLRFAQFQHCGGLPVHFMKMEHELPSHGVEMHLHEDFYELIVVRSGRVFHHLQGKVFRTLPGDVFLIPPMVPHNYIGDESLSLFNVLFLPSVLDRFRDELDDLGPFPFPLPGGIHSGQDSPKPVHIEKKHIPEFIGLIEDLCREQETHEPGMKLFLISGFLKILLILSRSSVPAEETGREDPCLIRTAGILARLEKEYARVWNMDELASLAGCSPQLFRRLVREMTGCSPAHHLLRVRLRQASRMLLGHARSVSEIASLCGFPDSNYFCRRFRKEFGISPRAYRASAGRTHP